MARINITLDQDEILALLDAGTADGNGDDGGAGRGAARTDVFRRILKSTLNGVLRAESAAQLHAAPYKRTGSVPTAATAYAAGAWPPSSACSAWTCRATVRSCSRPGCSTIIHAARPRW